MTHNMGMAFGCGYGVTSPFVTFNFLPWMIEKRRLSHIFSVKSKGLKRVKTPILNVRQLKEKVSKYNIARDIRNAINPFL